MGKSNISNTGLTFFIFGLSANKDRVCAGYKHRKSIIDIIDKTHGMPSYRWDGIFWGRSSQEYEKDVISYNNMYLYFSTLNYESFEKKSTEPIHHQSKFLINGTSFWYNVFERIVDLCKNISLKEKYQALISDSIVSSCFDTAILTNKAVRSNGAPTTEVRKLRDIDVWYPRRSFIRPSYEEREWLKENYNRWGIKTQMSDGTLVIDSIPHEAVDLRFSYINPSKILRKEIMGEARKNLEDKIGESFFVSNLLQKNIVKEKELVNRFDKFVNEEIQDKKKYNALKRAYNEEIEKISKMLKGVPFRFKFGNTKLTLLFDQEIDQNLVRYYFHILQPLELIQYYRIKKERGN